MALPILPIIHSSHYPVSRTPALSLRTPSLGLRFVYFLCFLVSLRHHTSFLARAGEHCSAWHQGSLNTFEFEFCFWTSYFFLLLCPDTCKEATYKRKTLFWLSARSVHHGGKLWRQEHLLLVALEAACPHPIKSLQRQGSVVPHWVILLFPSYSFWDSRW